MSTVETTPRLRSPRVASENFLDELRDLLGVFRRGWRLIVAVLAVCLTMAGIYLVKARREYQSTVRILVVQQGGRALNVGNNDPMRVLEGGDDLVPTHVALVSSPLVVGRAIKIAGLEQLPSLAAAVDPIHEAILHLKVGRPDRLAKIIQIDYRAWSPAEASRMADALTASYREFVEATYAKSSGEVVQLITKARDELSKELAAIEKKYVDFRQSRPISATDAAGRSLVARRLDEWDRATNEALIRAVQVRAQLELGRKLARDGVAGGAILQAMNQLGGGPADLRTLAASGSSDLAGYLGQLVQEQQQMAEKFGPNFAKVKELHEQINRVQARSRETRTRLEGAEVGDLLAALEQGVRSIEAMRNEYGKRFAEDREEAKKVEVDALTEANLKDGLERNRALFNTVVDQLKGAQFAGDFNAVSSEVIEPASMPRSPVSPKATLTLALAMMVGVLLGMGAAFAADRIDLRLRTVEDLRAALDFPVLGQIPQVLKAQEAAVAEFGLVGHAAPRSLWAEAYRAVRTNVEFLRRNRRLQVLLVASPHSGDGKSVSASNLAISLAQAGRRVILVDGDLRKPTQHRIHGLPNDFGLSSILRDGLPVHRALQDSSVEGLHVIAAGPEATNPAELLSSPRLAEFLDEARGLCDLLVVDSSPLLAVADPLILGATVDGIVLIVRASTLRHHEAAAVRERLAALGTPVLGTVVNGVGQEQGRYGYGYGYGYGGSYGPRDGTEGPVAAAAGGVHAEGNGQALPPPPAREIHS